jgi:zinc/manganese transport system permease protein
MDQLFSFPPSMIWPLAACLVLTGIHVYLGVHVIARKVIFVDLALAQIAALGTVTGVLLGYEAGKDITALYLYSLAFTIFGAFVFSATRMRSEKVPHEAIIGIVYAVTFAATILVLSKSALGPQELDHIIKGELLWVQPHMVIKTAIIYAVVGLFHFVFRKKFMAISFNAESAHAGGMNVRVWDFLFYMSFGFVITSSVAIAGVFLVFSYLIIPSVGAMLVSDKLGTRLALGWIGGSIISLLGVKLSWTTGLPTSPLIVVLFAALLVLTGMFRYLKLAPRKIIAVRNLAGAVAIVALFVGGVFLFRNSAEDPLEHTLHMLNSPRSTDRETALVNLTGYADRQSLWLPAVVQKLKDNDAAVRGGAVQLLMKLRVTSAVAAVLELLDDKSDQVVINTVQALRVLGDSSIASRLIEKAAHVDDPELKTSLLKTALEMGNPNAIPVLIDVIGKGGVFGDDAYDVLRGHVKTDVGKEQPGKLNEWWKENQKKLRWDAEAHMFGVRK